MGPLSMSRTITSLAVSILLILVFNGCAQQVKISGDSAVDEIVWPAYPDVKRIRYLYSISSAEDIDIRPGLFERIFNFLKGVERKDIVNSFGITKDVDGRLYVVDKFYQGVHVFDKKNGSHYT